MIPDLIRPSVSDWSDSADLPGTEQRPVFIGAAGAVFLAAFLLRLIPVFVWPGIAHSDEIFQSVEQGHRLIYGYGIVPWEFEYAARSWLLGYGSAGLMRISEFIGEGPVYYLSVIGACCAALASMSSVCAFLWGRRIFGLRAGLLAALVPLTWVDGIYYGSRVLSEVIAAHILVVASYLVEPGYRIESRFRLAFAGFLLGAVAVLRIHLLPAMALLWIWGDSSTVHRRFLPLTAGVLVAVGFAGWFDAVTWQYPFEPLWRNFYFNVVIGLSAFFGTDPWWGYVLLMARYWGGTAVVLLALALVGARKAPLLFWMMLAILVAHSVIPHKEYRFIYPAIVFLTILAGFGLVQLIRWIVAGSGAENVGRRTLTPLTYAAVSAGWLMLAAVNMAGQDYREKWHRSHDYVQASLYVSGLTSACGIGLYGLNIYDSGGYSYLHRRVALYEVLEVTDVATVVNQVSAFNILIANLGNLPREAPNPSQLGFETLRCFGAACVAHRPGGCQMRPMRRDRPPQGMPFAAPYPQSEGIVQPPD
jgi:hypothetical protein